MNAALVRAMPALFVVVWSTGFVVARYGMPHAGPMAFLAVRYALSLLAFTLWVVAARARWPRRGAQRRHLALTGVLMHAGYLGGVWAAVKGGIGAGLISLIVGLQPVVTALWISGFGGSGARVTPRQWLGLGCGLAGLVLVVGHKLQLGQASAPGIGLGLLALASITAGTLYQKRHVQACDVRSASVVQLAAALVVTAPLAWIEQAPVRWHPELFGAMAWSVFVLTIGGSSLLYLLIQRGAATSVTSLLYLVPPCTALMAWWLFDEPLGPATLAGFALTAAGVALVVRGAAPARPVRVEP